MKKRFTKRNRSILLRLFFGISSIVLVMMIIMAASIGYEAKTIVDQKTQNLLAQATTSSIQAVNSRLDSILSSLNTYTMIAKHNTITNGQAFDIFTDIVNQNKDISEIQYATIDGKYITYPGSPTDSNYDPRNTDWYKGAIESKGAYISDVFRFSQTEFPKIAISIPVYTEDEQIKGVVVSFVSVSKLSEFIKSIHIGETGYVFVVDQKGNLIAHPNQQYVLSNPSLKDLNIVRDVIAGHSGIGQMEQQNTSYTSAYDFNPKLRWGFLVAQADSEAKKDIYKLQSVTLVVSVLSLVLLSTVLWLYVRKMVVPIKEVQQKIEKFSEGDLTQTICVQTQDEIQHLAESFNGMSQKLSHIITRISCVINNVKSIAQNVSTSSQITFATQMNVVSMTDHLASEIEVQREQMNQIRTTVDEITNEISTIKENIDEASRLGDEAQNQTLQATEAVNHLQKDMGRIVDDMQSSHLAFADLNQSIQAVTLILSTIITISKRTKLLSLNARIEASRAGQHGLGFGVVADEIRALSEQTELATSEIEQVLNQVQDKLQTVATRLTQTDKASVEGIETLDSTIDIFSKIVNRTQELRQRLQVIEQFSQSINTQSLVIKEDVGNLYNSYENVFTGFQQAVASTQESATISQQFSDDSKELIELVEGLESEISYFQLRDENPALLGDGNAI
ncbi:methyl-accepting chemotaxis protein [Brevibacillus ginsengisoli]|uniref:methyl-accepting chemotaxis protein n=1 Tax=Brevibacillus ginsengisoli TaxID=363854 RepID=UPI003CE79F59